MNLFESGAVPESKGFVRQWQVATQRANVNANDLGDRAQFLEGGVALSSLDATNVAGCGVRFQRQILLGKPFGLTRRSNPLPEHLQRVWFSQPLQALAENEFPSSHYSDDLGLVRNKRIEKLYRVGAKWPDVFSLVRNRAIYGKRLPKNGESSCGAPE